MTRPTYNDSPYDPLTAGCPRCPSPFPTLSRVPAAIRAVAMIQANFLVYAQIPGGLELTFDDAADLLLALLGTTVRHFPAQFPPFLPF